MDPRTGRDKETKRAVLNAGIYSLKAVMNAGYDLGEKASIKIEQPTPDKILVSLKPHELSDYSAEALEAEFYNLLLDHQVRISVNDDYRVIREIIVAQAFQPCENLQEVIDGFKP